MNVEFQRHCDENDIKVRQVMLENHSKMVMLRGKIEH